MIRVGARPRRCNAATYICVGFGRASLTGGYCVQKLVGSRLRKSARDRLLTPRYDLDQSKRSKHQHRFKDAFTGDGWTYISA